MKEIKLTNAECEALQKLCPVFSIEMDSDFERLASDKWKDDIDNDLGDYNVSVEDLCFQYAMDVKDYLNTTYADNLYKITIKDFLTEKDNVVFAVASEENMHQALDAIKKCSICAIEEAAKNASPQDKARRFRKPGKESKILSYQDMVDMLITTKKEGYALAKTIDSWIDFSLSVEGFEELAASEGLEKLGDKQKFSNEQEKTLSQKKGKAKER